MKSFLQYRLCEERESEQIISKIKSLLALAARPGTESEGVLARERAESLAAKYGIDLIALEKEREAPKPAPAPAASPGPSQRPRRPNPFDDPAPIATPPDYAQFLHRFGWRREPRPYIAYVRPNVFELRDHCIVIDPEEGWKHMISGNARYMGKTARELLHHLSYNF